MLLNVQESAIGMKYNVLRRCGDHMGAVRDDLGRKLDAAGQQIESLMAADVRQKSDIMKLTGIVERMSDLLATRTERMVWRMAFYFFPTSSFLFDLHQRSSDIFPLLFLCVGGWTMVG
jgi:hypothetical protein